MDSRKIAVIDDSFINEEMLSVIRTAAERYGFSVDYYPDEASAEAYADAYEILFGFCQPDFLKRMSRLRWFCCDFAGVERFLSDEIYPRPDVMLSNSSGAYGIAISEHITMVALMLLRNMPAFQKEAQACHWADALPMRSIYGRFITIVGTGNIGTSFAHVARALGASSVCGVNRSGLPADEAFTRTHAITALDELLPQTELLVLTVPATAQTNNLLSRERIALLPCDAIVINVGRGSTIDQDALCEALNEERLAGAALDVMQPEPLPPEHPLWRAKNILITPHISGNMVISVTQSLNVTLFCEDLKNYAENKPLMRLVDRKRGY